MRVAVIGAGVLGAAVAQQLARGGARVTLLERDVPGAGASGTSFAWLNSREKHHESYHRLNVDGIAEHHRLAAELAGAPAGGAPWLAPTGALEWAASAAEQEALAERLTRLNQLDYPWRRLSTGQLRHLEPDLRGAGGGGTSGGGAVYFPAEGYVLPAPLLAALLGDATEHAATLRCGAQVDALFPAEHGVEVAFSDGERERFDRVVCCAGRGTAELTAAADTAGEGPVPLAGLGPGGGASAGWLACTEPVPVRLSRVVTTAGVHLRPDGAGRMLAHSAEVDALARAGELAGPEEVADELMRRASEVLDLAACRPGAHARRGLRVLPADGYPVAGFLGGPSSNCYVLATHSGITLAPLLGRLAAGEILGGEPAPPLDPFRPQRFEGAVWAS